MTKKILRLKLTDFIDTDIEEYVLQFLSIINNNIPIFLIHCWYLNGEISNSKLNTFKTKYDIYIKQLELLIYNLNSYETPVWYDIINETDSHNLTHYKFRSIYTNHNELINCIIEFNSIIKFDYEKSSHKPFNNLKKIP